MCTIFSSILDTVGKIEIGLQGESKKMSPLTKYDTIAPNLEINEIYFRDIDPDVHADSRYKNSIDRSRNV